jgi:Protein of unknown function (DUF2939)
MTRRRIVAAVIAALIMLAGAWYWGSPWWTVWRISRAARLGDAKQLYHYADFATITARQRAEARTIGGTRSL